MRRRRADGLFERIATFEALCAAARRAAAGKRRVPAPAGFLANLEGEVLRLERELQAGTWRPGGYVSFEIRDPKHRQISAAPFRDRVVHHAVHAVVAPLFERGFIAHSYANRAGKGTHRAVARYERLRDRHRWVLRGDIFRYFPAIDHEVLGFELRPEGYRRLPEANVRRFRNRLRGLRDRWRTYREGTEFRVEQVRRAHLMSELRKARLTGIRVTVPVEALEGRLSGLPAGVVVERDRIEVRYAGAKEAVVKLVALAQALNHDYERFEALVAGEGSAG